MTDSEKSQSWFGRLCHMCCCCGWCCRYQCCCCENDREKHPLLSAKDSNGVGINGKPIPDNEELQELEYRFSEPSSGVSTPIERQSVYSEASEPPDEDDVEPIEKQPRGASENGTQGKSWKLLADSDTPQDSLFTIQIRKQIDQ